MTQTVTVGGNSEAVVMAEGVRQAFLAGTWDACGQLVANAAAIRATAARLPYVTW